MQGLLTCLLGLAGYLLIADFPEKSARKGFQLKFLTEKEAAFVVARIEQDRHDAIPQEFHVGEYMRNALDMKVWGFAALFGLTTTNTYAIAYFLPIILNDGMGFGVAASECLIAPPYVLAAIVMFAFAYLGDKYHLRSPFILINGCVLLIGKFRLIICIHDIVLTSSRSPTSWFRQKRRCSLLRCLPRYLRLQRQRTLRPDMASKQHPWPVEACLVLCYLGRCRRYWRYHWWNRVP